MFGGLLNDKYIFKGKMKISNIVYKTTCSINGKIYIGVHINQSEDKDFFDGYLGSGLLLKRAIKKFGIENFTRETLFSFETIDECFEKEKNIVTEDFIKSGVSYNIAVGGNGGNTMCGMSNNQRKLVYKKIIRSKILNGTINHSEDARKNMSNSAKQRIIEKPNTLPDNKGRVYSDDAMKSIRNGAKKRLGNIRITDGINEKEIPQTDTIPDGWYRGRKKNFKKFKKHTSESKRKIAENNKISGVVCYNNGVINIKIPKNEIPPIGFVKGLLIRTKRKIWINNGIVEKTIPYDEVIENGFIKGRIKKDVR